jgi:hypothetical protein
MWSAAGPVPAHYQHGGELTALRPNPATPRAVQVPGATPPLDLPPGMPMAVTPPRQPAEEARAEAGPAPGNSEGHAERTAGHPPGERDAADSRPAPLPLPPLPVSSPSPPQAAPAEAVMGGEKPAPLRHVVNSKRIVLNFEVTDVGPSGLSAVEVWHTRDGKEWFKLEPPVKAKAGVAGLEKSGKAYLIEVDKEGTYGFTLLARSGVGLAHQPPVPGDLPQVWVTVDLTRPVVRLLGVTPGARGKSQTVTVRWQASDAHLSSDPITLSYAEQETGPWHTLAAGLPNTGRYEWQVPAGTPARFLLRVEAVDEANNVGRVQTPRPVLLDPSRPNVSILGVEPSGR